MKSLSIFFGLFLMLLLTGPQLRAQTSCSPVKKCEKICAPADCLRAGANAVKSSANTMEAFFVANCLPKKSNQCDRRGQATAVKSNQERAVKSCDPCPLGCCGGSMVGKEKAKVQQIAEK